MAKSPPKKPVLGRWRIVSMSTWDEEYIDEEVEGTSISKTMAEVTFTSAISKDKSTVDKRCAIASPQSNGAGTAMESVTPLKGRAWAVIENDQLSGMIFFHGGDESEFVATNNPTTKRKDGKRR